MPSGTRPRAMRSASCGELPAHPQPLHHQQSRAGDQVDVAAGAQESRRSRSAPATTISQIAIRLVREVAKARSR